MGQLQTHLGAVDTPVIEIPRQRALPRIQIDRPDRIPLPHQANDDVHRCRGLSGPALLIAENNDCRVAHAGFNQIAVS